MSTTTLQQPGRASVLAVTEKNEATWNALPRLSGRALVLATDGSADAIPAARVAQALARAYGANVHVVHVVDTRGVPIPPPLDAAFGLADAAAGEAVHAEQSAAIREGLSSALSTQVTWPIHVTLGTPAQAIAREATNLDAVLIVVGLRRHGVIDRAMGDETTLTLMKQATRPVLAVVPGSMELPARVLAALDFSSSSIHGAQLAAAIAAPDAKVTLAYVPVLSYEDPNEGEALIHQLGVASAFAIVERGLGRDGLRFDRVVLHHTKPSSPASLLLDYADSMHCDLIVAGSARHGRMEQWLLGSVSTELVRDGRHSMLVIPRPPNAA